MLTQNKRAFTLVELIIVITILAILATIGFISYQSYIKDARDSNRITTVKEISKGLDIVFTKTSDYPMPDGTLANGTINGVIYAYKGTVGDAVSQAVRMQKRTDPMSKEEYTYGVNTDQNQYQIAAVLENNTLAQVNNLTNTTYADLGVVAKVSGNYPGYVKYSTGGQMYIANIPSLLWNNTGAVDLLNTTTKYIVNKKTNLPYKLNSSTDLGTKDANTIIQEITGTGVATLTGVNITNITSSNISSTFSGAILASFGGDISKITSNVIGGIVASTPTQDTPAPFIPSENFSVTTYAGNGGTLNVNTGLDMISGNNGGLVWIKNKGSIAQNVLVDTVRGAGLRTVSNSTSADNGIGGGNLLAFNNNGFKPEGTLESGQSGQNYVAWSWKTTDKASGLTNHGKTYSASYNARAGFSIVSYVGEGNNNSQIPHYLGKAPELIMIKDRGEIENWSVGGLFSGYASSTPKILKLNTSDAYSGAYNSFSDFSNSSFINNNIFTVDGSDLTNQLNHNYISYSFTSVPGFSKIGTYNGTSAVGNSINIGFKPAFVMIKRIDSVENWVILDNKRTNDGYRLSPDSTAIEDTTVDVIDFSNTGFTLKDPSLRHNASGGTYLYMAIAQ